MIVYAVEVKGKGNRPWLVWALHEKREDAEKHAERLRASRSERWPVFDASETDVRVSSWPVMPSQVEVES